MTIFRALVLAIIVPGIAAMDPVRGPTVVEMTSNMTFMPRDLTVVAGDVVVWKNTAEMSHTVNTDVSNCRSTEAKEWVQVPPGATVFFSGEIQPGGEYRIHFEVPGTYQYLCVYHEAQTMRGTIVVQGAEVK